jgi:3-dehydroquinate dehydratase II
MTRRKPLRRTEGRVARVLVIHGPNLNLLGLREPEIYGTVTLAEIDAALCAWGRAAGWEVVTFQSNHEGEIIDRLQQERAHVSFIVINPGAYSHTSYAIRDCLAALGRPAIEVHLSNIHAREEFRRTSVIAPVCRAQISGLGLHSYTAALQAGVSLFGGDAS